MTHRLAWRAGNGCNVVVNFLATGMQIFGALLTIGVVAALVKFGLKLLKYSRDMKRHLQHIADKINYVERRMENAAFAGEEVARHLAQLVVEYDEDTSKGSVLYPQRLTT